jgi:hypothetical protein
LAKYTERIRKECAAAKAEDEALRSKIFQHRDNGIREECGPYPGKFYADQG